jgi:hypothetical protein
LLTEVFDDLAYKFPTGNYINTLSLLQNKYPNIYSARIREGHEICVEPKKDYILSGPYIHLSDWKTNEYHQLLAA